MPHTSVPAVPSVGFAVNSVLPSPDAQESDAASDMDALLDKIAKSGIASLTAKERARLEAGRAELLKKDRR